MSTDAEFVDGATFEEAMKSVRSDDTGDLFLVVGHIQGDPNRLELVTVGQETSQLVEYLEDDRVMYALARYETKFDMSITVKFVYFRWIGEQVPVTKKGRFGVVHGSVVERFNPYHSMVETSSREDIEDSKILQKLEETSGTKSKVIESTEGRQERGFTASQLPKRGPTNKFGVNAIPKEGSAVQVSDSVYEDIAEVRNDELPVRWIVAQYRDCNPKGPIDSYQKGEGGLDELKACLEPENAMYALYRVSDVVDDIVTVKFVFITWVGTKVKPMAKAKISTQKGTVQQVFGQTHVALFATDLSDITEKVIMDKVTSASGTRSHVK
ncbi:uncharacterized protein LOC124269828 [Haliotis rubra]|uniref:uncharacterized protein LOC124269828 n=1 Tax=Haliotis rubra TaxID=36100 RepID=UPI001EE53E0D|nr:uncharacterized protein LOC124269828 [Haliotis rubra]XP_046560820.1 uncharacterized protein LOC124269828 [Haliotis rubra]XP_046560821.1 uncharacterized protein LOC124269828 [Haliotis rubra]